MTYIFSSMILIWLITLLYQWVNGRPVQEFAYSLSIFAVGMVLFAIAKILT